MSGIDLLCDADNFIGNLFLTVLQESPQTLRHLIPPCLCSPYLPGLEYWSDGVMEGCILKPNTPVLQHSISLSPTPAFPSPWLFRHGKSSSAPSILWRLGRPARPSHPWRILRELPKTYRCALRPPGSDP